MIFLQENFSFVSIRFVLLYLHAGCDSSCLASFIIITQVEKSHHIFVVTMSECGRIGSGWDHMMCAIENCIKNKNSALFDSCHELEAIQKTLNIPEIR